MVPARHREMDGSEGEERRPGSVHPAYVLANLLKGSCSASTGIVSSIFHTPSSPSSPARRANIPIKAISGSLEAIGIAASIIQVAELDTKLSVKLFSFYRELKGANKFIQDLSSDVAITSRHTTWVGGELERGRTGETILKTSVRIPAGCFEPVRRPANP